MLLRGSATSTCDAAGVPAGFCEEGLPLFGSPIPEHGAEVTPVKHICGHMIAVVSPAHPPQKGTAQHGAWTKPMVIVAPDIRGFPPQGEEHHAPALLPWVWTTRAAATAEASTKDGEGSMPGGGSSTAGSEASAPEERIEVGSRPSLCEKYVV